VSAPVSADYLIIGSGIAGLRAAVTLAASGRVLILTKSDPSEGSTGYAQGGIAAAVGDDDSIDRHVADTLAAGDGLCDAAAVRVLVDEGRRYVQELIAWGARFDRDGSGRLALAREGAHSVRRVLHAHDATGREIGRTLAGHLAEHPTVEVLDHAMAVQAIVDRGRVAGVRFLNSDGALVDAHAKATLLATGGAGQVYRETTNPSVATGDGVALAYRAGASVADLEFVQFHPTALSIAGMPRYLLSEALRGEGAHLINAAGERFMSRYDGAGELAPRDRVARAIVLEAERTGGPVALTLAHLPAGVVHERFPVITTLCREAGLDLARDSIPVAPAAHYAMGGVKTDLDGRTSLRGLFAAGETACTGVHGANRLASNSLLEGLVFGARAGRAMAQWNGVEWPDPSAPWSGDPVPSGNAIPVPLSEPEVRDLMWRQAGIFRDERGLRAALDRLDAAWQAVAAGLAGGGSLDAAGWRLASLVTVGRLIARGALRREESRGAHSRTDFPMRDDIHFQQHLSESRA
jgi:L-aspartate oxidase